MKPILESHIYSIVLTDHDDCIAKTIVINGYSKHNAEIDAIDLYGSLGLYKVKSIKQLPGIARLLAAFPALVLKLF